MNSHNTDFKIPNIQKLAKKVDCLGFIYLSVLDYSQIAGDFGSNTYDLINNDIGKFLNKSAPEIFREGDLNVEIARFGNAFLILIFREKPQETITYKELSKFKEKIKTLVSSEVLLSYQKSLDNNFGCLIGTSIMNYKDSVDFAGLFYESIENAIMDSAQEKGKDNILEKLVLHDIINKSLLNAVYQPIINIRDEKVLGFEFLSRGTLADYQNPEILFNLAYKHDLVLPLDRRCRENAFKAGRIFQQNTLLFINSEIESIFDIQFNMKNTMLQIEKNNLASDRIIFELTEKAAIKDLSAFRQAIKTLKTMGFKIAIDDIGHAYSGLKKIVELEPDFIKIDMSLIRNIHKNVIKKSLIKSVADFAQDAKINVIAEGVETRDELEVIKDIGIENVQGFYLFYPTDNIEELKKLNTERIRVFEDRKFK